MIYTMFDLEFTKTKKVIKKDGKRLLIDFDKLQIEKPNSNDIIIEEEKLKEEIVKPKIKVKPPKKGKKLF